MAESKAGVLRVGAGLLWRRQRVFWWAYAANLLLGLMATVPVASRLGGVLDRSLMADRLYRGFDIAAFVELVRQPDVPHRALMPMSFFFALLFTVFMLFLAGGVLEVYRRDQTLTTGELFQACGTFFWRFVRLAMVLLIVLVPIAILHARVQRLANRLASDAPQEMLGFSVQLAGVVVVLVLLLAVRLWFDMAQVYTVVERDRRVRIALKRAFKLTFANFGQLLWMYLRPLLLAVAALLIGLWIWMKFVRAEWVGVSFLGGQLALLIWLATRFWLRASEMVWYQQMEPAPVASITTAESPRPEP